MRIAVNTRFLIKDQLEGYGYYILELFKRITTQYPQHRFLFLFDRPFDESFLFSSNIEARVLTPAARHGIGFRWWYDVKLASAAKQWKADVLVSPDGFCSFTTSIPQLLVVHDLSFKHYPQFIPKHHWWFYKLHQQKFLKKATQIVTVSAFSKADIIHHYPFTATKIAVITNAAQTTFVALNWQQQQQVKDGWADGREYFLFVGGIHPRKNLMGLLKAFSHFKRWSQSNMQLLVAGRLAWQYNSTVEKLQSYKYRQDVKLLDYVPQEQLTKLMASAYALVYPSFFEGFGLPLLEAMQCGTPVITSNTSSMPEIAGDAALYANPDHFEELGNHMLTLYKNENQRNALIQKGFIQAQQFSWDASAEQMMQLITKTAQHGFFGNSKTPTNPKP
jgi:glycosyltransferase involved in cell wall biosynthesis